MATDLKLISDLHFAVLARPQQCPRLLQTRFIKRLGSAAHVTPATSGLETCVHPLTQYVPLKLRQRGKDVKGQLPARRRGVDVLGEEGIYRPGRQAPGAKSFFRSSAWSKFFI